MATVIIFIIVLLVTVTVHEWGHYITDKKSGMLVEEFGFGLPPRVWSWKKGETLYTINALPIGGFVKIAGENGVEQTAPLDRQFESKPWYLKSLVLVAGVVCNILLAIVLFTAAYSIGMPAISDTGTPTIVNVVQTTPAAKAGLAVGDAITSVVIEGSTITPIDTERLHEALTTSSGDVTITYTRKGDTRTATITPEGIGDARKIGLAVDRVSLEKLSIPKAFVLALKQTATIATTIFSTIGELLAGLFKHNNVAGSLMGPVGLAHEVGGAARIGFAYLLAFTAMISVNLAVLNIMPFPALDGGRLLIVLLERITRRKFSSQVVAIIHTVGFLILLGLMVYLTVGDIRKLF